MIIEKMYDIELISNNYNPDANTSITITATATDYKGNPVIGESLTIKHNGTAVGNAVTTNSNGQASVVTTCGSGGTHTFTCKSSSLTISVNPYPVGSIYTSINSTSPATLFGGTWAKIEGRFLLASGTTSGEDPTVDNTYTLGDTDGSKDAVVVSHNHTQASHNHAPSSGGSYKFAVTTGNISAGTVARKLPDTQTNGYYFVVNDKSVTIAENTTTDSKQPTINNNGESGANKNMPPYLVVNVWERTA